MRREIPLFGNGNNGERVGQVLGADCRAFQRIERDIDGRSVARTDFLANVEHRRFVTLALADYNCSCDWQAIKFLAHRINGRLIRRHLVATSAQTCCSNSRPLGYAHEFERQNAVETRFILVVGFQHSNPCVGVDTPHSG